MEKIHRVIVIIGLIAAFGLVTKSADAQVVFDPDPVFQEVEVLPGDKDPLPGTITITNQTSDTREYYLGAGILSGAGLADAIPLSVFGSGIDETVTVTELELAPIFLGEFSAGETRDYTLSASYLDNGTHLVQGAELRFVILVGTDDGEVVTSGGGSGGGGGGGGGLLPPALTILNTQVASISATPSGYDVSITWLTNLAADSLLVFGPASGGPYPLDPADPQLGYPQAVSLGGLRTGHSLLLSGLVPGEYVFRVASSQGGGYTSSPEYRFEITSTGELVPEVLGVFQGGAGAGTRSDVTPLERTLAEVRGAFQTRVAEAVATTTENTDIADAATPTEPAIGTSAEANTAVGLSSCSPRYQWLIIAISGLVGLLAMRIIQLRLPPGYRRIPIRSVWVAAIGVGVLGYFLSNCSWWWVILAWVGILCIAWFSSRKSSQKPS